MRKTFLFIAVVGLLSCGENPAQNSEKSGSENPVVTIYRVSFNANGGSGTVPNAQNVQAGSRITLPGRGNLTKDKYVFGGWNTSSDGKGKTYKVDTIYTPTDDITFYAKWDATSYTATFNANGGSGAVPAQTVDVGSPIILPASDGLTRDGYIFVCWSINSSGTGIAYSVGSSYTPKDNIVFYARWARLWQTFIDIRDGKTYKKTTIGNQTWMAENLDYDVPDDTTDTCRRITSGNSYFCATGYGRFYSWVTAMGGAPSSDAVPSGVQGICPAEWHIPSKAEWDTLVNNAGAGDLAGRRLKADTIWNDHQGNLGGGTDDYGFYALPGGSLTYSEVSGFSSDNNFGSNAYWWTATLYDSTGERGWGRTMAAGSSRVGGSSGMIHGIYGVLYSVRCVQD